MTLAFSVSLIPQNHGRRRHRSHPELFVLGHISMHSMAHNSLMPDKGTIGFVVFRKITRDH